ncbi:MAG: AI-2E family transporter [Planctomycetota bacterium]
MTSEETNEKSLPQPWDRIFSLATRIFVWGLLVGVLYILRPFLLLVFLTFVFAYIQAHGVDGLAHRIKNRAGRVVIVGMVFLGTLFATGFTLLPQVQEQANQFLVNKDKYIADADTQANKFLANYPSMYNAFAKHSEAPDATSVFGPKRPGAIPRRKPLEQTGDLPNEDTTEEPDKVESGSTTPAGEGENTETGNQELTPSETGSLEASEGDGTENDEGDDESDAPKKPLPKLHIVRDLLENVTESLAKNPLEIGQSVLSYASSFLLSLLFSFLIVLDLGKIRRGIQGLQHTKIGWIYDEVADNIAGFGQVLGRALEAQLFIAVCNTILTALGIWFLGLPNLLVLSTIVFFCSFIPVVGTFISSTPIALLALQSGGVTTMLIAIIMIMVVHALETYVLNPQIYGHHMHMNPVLVLIVLTIGGKLFGIWGLILGIPIVNYVFRHAIRDTQDKPAAT